MRSIVLDTNVALVAVGAFEVDGGQPTRQLKVWCLNQLDDIMNGRVKLIIDEAREFVSEYMRKTPNFPLGEQFIKWLSQNMWQLGGVETVPIHKTTGGYEEFPADKDLQEFDLADRKFVAVAIAHPQKPPVLEATDGKWWKWEKTLSRHGIRVEFGDSDFIKGLCQKKHNCQGDCEGCGG